MIEDKEDTGQVKKVERQLPWKAVHGIVEAGLTHSSHYLKGHR